MVVVPCLLLVHILNMSSYFLEESIAHDAEASNCNGKVYITAMIIIFGITITDSSPPCLVRISSIYPNNGWNRWLLVMQTEANVLDNDCM